MSRDSQKSRVYAWEDKIIAPFSKGAVPFDKAQTFVDGVWLAHGWLYPPRVEPMPKQTRRIMASANRAVVRLRESVPDWVILHELAHTLTCDVDGHSAAHGADFVGIYIKLLERVLNVPALMTMYTLQKAKISYNIAALPWMQRR